MAMQLDSYFTRPAPRRYLLIEQSCDNHLHHFTFALEIKAGESRPPHIEHKAGASRRRPPGNSCADPNVSTRIPTCSGS
jgi:hypothetical protein